MMTLDEFLTRTDNEDARISPTLVEQHTEGECTLSIYQCAGTFAFHVTRSGFRFGAVSKGWHQLHLARYGTWEMERAATHGFVEDENDPINRY